MKKIYVSGPMTCKTHGIVSSVLCLECSVSAINELRKSSPELAKRHYVGIAKHLDMLQAYEQKTLLDEAVKNA
jgi:hypothetical protein